MVSPHLLPDGNDFVAIDAGGLYPQPHVPSGYSLALKSNGSIISWGSIHRPYGFESNDFTAIAAGNGFCLALKTDGSIAGWGSNDYSQATPPEGNDFVAIAAGSTHGLALKSDGSIVGWGSNSSDQATPPEGNNFIAISAG
jgi:alpha-tubulin suppressor-like RCC1 family protein